MEQKPHIAIVTANTLEAMGLAGIIERMMPVVETCIFSDFEKMKQAYGQTMFFHFFISARTLMDNASFFLQLTRRTIVLVHAEETLPLQGFHTLNVQQPEEALIKSILTLAHKGHHADNPNVPNTVRHAVKQLQVKEKTPKLTHRETDVLRLIVKGMLNKEIADQLGVGLTTVITHRKNLTTKLNIKAVSGLTVYAVTHGLVKVEDI